jgi:hypothetical protein
MLVEPHIILMEIFYLRELKGFIKKIQL